MSRVEHDQSPDASSPMNRAGLTGTDIALNFEGVQFVYPDGTEAIDEVSMAVPKGEIVSVIGPSGCGKSTLLRLATRLLLPTKGRMTFGQDIGERAVCMLFQEDVLLPWLTARQNVLLHYRFQGRRKLKHAKEAKERVSDLIAMVGLSGFEDYYPRQLSGGMRRRIGLLQVIAHLPKVLLLDEPFSAIDEPTRIDIHQEVRSLLTRFGITAILVTHDLAEAISLSDRVIVLSQRPATIAREYPVDLGPNRNMRTLRESSSFLDLYGEIWQGLRHELDAK